MTESESESVAEAIIEMVNIEDIDIDAESRFRKDIGNDDGSISLLCDSIREVGLVHPIVITKDKKKKLIAGHRRIEAYKRLGRSKIPAYIIDIDSALELGVKEAEIKRKKAEFHENTARKNFTVSERVAIKRYLEPIEREKAKERQLTGKRPSVNSAEGGQSRDKVAAYLGKNHDTLSKEEKIVQAAEENPTEYGPILEQVDNGQKSSDKAFREIQEKESLKQIQQKTKAGISLTDEDIMTSLGISIRPYDVWNFSGLDNRFGTKYPGQIPADIVFNVLYFFTKPNDLIVDFMAGGGVVGDVCNAFNGRRCLMYDINPPPSRSSIVQHDITDVNLPVPSEARDAELFFWDPPYYKKKEEEYGPHSISALTRDEYLKTFRR